MEKIEQLLMKQLKDLIILISLIKLVGEQMG
jgi:hypothetical protein